MENWFQDVGKTALLEALGDTCDRINESFKTDFEAYTQTKVLNLTTQLENLRRKASQVDRLETENFNLKAEIKSLKNASCERAHSSGTIGRGEAQPTLRTPLAPRSVNQLNSKRTNKSDIESLALPELQSEFWRVDQKYTKLHDKYINVHDALVKSKDIIRERTDKLHHWVDHAKKLGQQSQQRGQRIKKLEAKLAEVCQEPLNLSFSSDDGDVEVAGDLCLPAPIPTPTLAEMSRRQPRAPTPTQTCGDELGRSMSPLKAQDPPGFSRSDLTTKTGNIRSTNELAPHLPPLPQNRQSIEAGQLIKSEPSSDTPVVVSERCVRKRKYVGTYDRDDRSSPARVKIESSPEVRSMNKSRPSPSHESIDFDTEYHRVETPKKQAKYQHPQNMQLDGNYDDDDAVIQGQSQNAKFVHSTNPTKPRSQEPTDDIYGQDPTTASYTDFQDEINPALQPLHNNQLLHPRLNPALNNRIRKYSAMPRGLAGLAEDGYPTQTVTPLTSKTSSGGSILKQLLDTPSRAQENGRPLHDHLTEDGQPSNFHLQLPKRRDLPFGKDDRKRASSAAKSSPRVPTPTPAFQSSKEDHNTETTMNWRDQEKTKVPLRQSPRDKLRLDDFKINPNVNEGYDYAFTDVVRKKDDRTCLQGCVKENCCGHKFRVLAHACRASTRPYEFRGLLESYLGDDCHRLSTMSEDQKEALWVEAKIKELANTSSKHRHRYQRMTTPPGFWRPDFPSTQEGEEYNEEAAQLEREIIDERYREAMRPGGLWVFRDE
ncbi:DNA repair protein endonuclease SAE2/CtIP C-terminus-domain-containing protein [Xylaria arbuscula]|nr:DNA repair protein endonuclease SAE2/CtIP C-terminus-domain-containing protein [Xylaria arbuscula]